MIYSREWFEDKVVIIRKPEHLEILKGALKITKDIEVEYPSIVYKGINSIDIRGITEENLLKLKTDKDFTRKIIEMR